MSVFSTLRRQYVRLRFLPKTLQQIQPGTFQRHVLAPARQGAGRGFRGVKAARMRLIDRARGYEAGNASFWGAQISRKKWPHVHERLLMLAQDCPEAIPQFVRLTHARTHDPVTLINMARSALTRTALRACLLENMPVAEAQTGKETPLWQRMKRSRMWSSGLVAAATLVLDDAQAGTYAAFGDAIHPDLLEDNLSLVDSCGTRLPRDTDCLDADNLMQSGFRHPKTHRLIISPSARDAHDLALLFQGAASVTVFAVDDLYGKSDFSEAMAHAGPAEVTVEHARSRITRFSVDYHRIHEETRRAAQTLISALARRDNGTLIGTNRMYAELALADHLFFPCLKLAALEKLIAAPDFDHIVVATGDTRTTNAFCELLSGVSGLCEDPRVEIVSASHELAERGRFGAALQRLVTPARLPFRARVLRRPIDRILHEVDTASAAFFGDLVEWSGEDRPRLVMATTQVGAYNVSSRSYCDSLNASHDLKVAFLGSNIGAFFSATDTEASTVSPDDVIRFPSRPIRAFARLDLWLRQAVQDALPEIDAPGATHVIHTQLSDIVRGGLLSFLVHHRLIETWFSDMKDHDRLPQAVVLTPFRGVRVAAFADVARRFGVPSIALEPHGLTASYCRYAKVSADYYGVVSSFFAQAAVEGFGVPEDRAVVLGAPRLRAPAVYDRDQAKTAARKAVSSVAGVDLSAPGLVLTFFSQPSNWEQVAEVWDIILQATDGLDCLLLLKTHPEETPSRVAAYHKITQARGAEERVHRLDTDATAAIEIADIVLSGYSAVMLEATLLRRPVFCVTNGDVDYPVDQHRVVGAPLFRNVADLRAEIMAFRNDPAPYHVRTEAFLTQEPQFVSGPEPHLRALIEDVISRNPADVIRTAEDVPATLFLDGPHRPYTV